MQSNPYVPKTLPVAVETLISLFDALSAELEQRACDNTLKKTMMWLVVHGYDVSSVTKWLKGHGGYCDCEVLLNVEPRVIGAE
jgi:hypothetical protein